MEEIFLDIGIMIIVASIFGIFARFFKQPLIPAYILAGVIIGPIFNIINDGPIIQTLSEIGIAFLLFSVGLELDFKKLKDIGPVASFGGMLQFATLFLLGFCTASFLGYKVIHSVYFALIVVFSSTMVVIKILSDKKELDSLHGRIIIGLLLMQDVLAIFAILILSSINDTFSYMNLIKIMIIGVGLLLFSVFSSKFLFPRLFKYAAKIPETLFLLSVSVAFTFSIIFDHFGFSIAIGAFIAGVSLGNLPYNLEISSRIRSLKDFFATVFFVSLGIQLVFSDVQKLIVPVIVFVFFTIVIKLLFNFILIAVFGYEKRTCFLTALSLAQVSEFGLIIVAQGIVLGHIGKEFLSMVIVLAVITITLSSYFMKFNAGLYHYSKNFLKLFNFLITGKHQIHNFSEEDKYDVLLIGYDRIGYDIFKGLKKISNDVLVVDFNPDIVKKLVRNKVSCIYGDIGDAEILERIDFKDLKMVVSTIPELRENLMLIKKSKRVNPKTPVFVTSMHVEDALQLYEAGADYVILPHLLGGEHVSIMLEEVSTDITKLINNKATHIKALHLRRKSHPHHFHFFH
jgi:Kef-type K+ transport system membrane component KefB